jgi:membrane-associated protease RseP (regulator of RpoE activity)
MSKLLGISSVALALLAASAALAEDGADVAKEAAAPIRVDVQPGEYWLGVQVGLPDDDLRSKLKLPEDQGLVVENVVPDSPAAKGGIKAHDVLMKAGDTPLKKLQDLIEAVQNAKDKPLSIQILREGKEEKIAVTPAKRPAGAIPGMPVPLPGNPEWDKVLKWLERAQAEGVEGEGKEGQPLRFHIFRPGAILPHDVMYMAAPALPDDMTVTVSKTGKKPAEIVVKQGEEKWEATETDLSKLPEKVRPFVEPMLGRGHFNVRVLGGGPGMTVPLPPPTVVAPGIVPHLEGRLERRVEEMGKRLDELNNLIQQLQENQPKHKKTPKEPKDKEESK